MHGAIAQVHAQYGGGTGALGYPRSDESSSSGSYRAQQYFERGAVRIMNDGRVEVMWR